MTAKRSTLCLTAAALLVAAASVRSAAQSADLHRPLPPYIDPNVCVWEEVFPEPPEPPEPAPPAPVVWLGSGPRVAVVVWEDITVPAGERLYSNVGDLIQVYAQDVADTGFQVAVFKFYGMAEDPVGDPDPENPVPDLRRKLSELRGQGGLSGVQLIGNCPYILREPPGGGGDCECEFFLADLDATLYDTPNADLRQGVFDDWSGDGADIWVARIMARPSLVAFINAHTPGASWTEELVLREYFLRNHALRWQVFDARARALLFATSAGCTAPLPSMQDIFGSDPDDDVVVEAPPIIPPPGPPPALPWGPADVYLRDLAYNVYTHIHHLGFHGNAISQLHTRHEGGWSSYPDYGVWCQHYVEEGYHYTVYQPAHPGCENPATLSYVFDTCSNGEFAYYPDDYDPTLGACCYYVDLPCTVTDHWHCAYAGGSFHAGADCLEECPPWSPEWPLPGESPCIAEVAAFNPNPAGPYGFLEHGAGLVVLAASGVTSDAFGTPYYYGALRDGGSVGDGVRAMQIIEGRLLYVLLGDGTLKSGLRWIREPGDPTPAWWSEGLNWTGGHAPESEYPESLRHDNADEIQVDVGTSEPFYIRRFFGDGAAGGGLRILPRSHLEANEDVVLSPGYTVALDAGPSPEELTQFSIGGALSGGAFTLGDHTRVSVLGTAAASVLSGSWIIAGADAIANFVRAQGDPDSDLTIAMSGGATLTVSDPVGLAPFLADGQAQAILYGDGENELQAGSGEHGQVLYLGDHSTLRPAEGASDPHLTLDLSCGLSIASYFGWGDVREHWDSNGVDVILRVIPAPAGAQKLELISPELSDWWPGTPVAFLDVPCRAGFQSLLVDGATGGAQAGPLEIVNEQNNWPDPPPGGDPEALYFENVTIGAYRELRFTAGAGLIYYFGDLEWDPTASFFLDGYGLETPASVIKPVVSSVFGDFNGDCKLTNKELSDLQAAISSGPYNPVYDVDCDGVLAPGNGSPELARFLYNYSHQPPPGCGESLMSGGGGLGMESAAAEGLDDGADSSEAVDLAGLAQWLAEQISPEDLAAFVAQASATAAEHADDAIGADIAELLSYLP